MVGLQLPRAHVQAPALDQMILEQAQCFSASFLFQDAEPLYISRRLAYCTATSTGDWLLLQVKTGLNTNNIAAAEVSVTVSILGRSY